MLDGPGKQPIYLNISEISSIREPQDYNKGHFAPGIRCVVVMSNGNIVAVLDECLIVRDRIEVLLHYQ